MLDLKSLRTFAALREGGSVAAAECLYPTQSALSHQIKALEYHFGTPLSQHESQPLRFTRPASASIFSRAF
jgi:LysR family transcriptional regulator, regulator for metE and metH